MINFQKLNLYRMFLTQKKDSKKRLHAFANKGASLFLDKGHKILFQRFLTTYSLQKEPLKFYLTDDTVKRLENIPTDEESLKGISWLTEKKGDTGFIFMNDKLHCIYAITSSEVHIIVSSRADIESYSLDPAHTVNNICQAFIKVNLMDEKIYCSFNNPLDALTNTDNLLRKDIHYARFLKSKGENFLETESQFYKDYLTAYTNSFKEAQRCFRAFLFVYLSKVVTTTRISIESVDLSIKERLENKTKPSIDVIRVDTLYDENLKVINPFNVKGHFRNQPIGKDRAEFKLIWIDEFMKTGYNRKATKEKLGI